MSDGFFDDDDGFDDSAFLQEVDAIEAATQQPSTTASQISTITVTPATTQAVPTRFKPALQRHPSSDDFDDTFDLDVEELEKLDAFNADSYAFRKQPLAGPSTTRQTTLDGRIVPSNDGAKAQSKLPFERMKSTGSKEPKAKTWDRTAFAATGFWSTKKDPKSKDKDIGKGKSVAHDEDIDEDFDEEDVEFEQFPTPHVDDFETRSWVRADRKRILFTISNQVFFGDRMASPPPPMRLKPDLLAAREWIFPLNRDRRDYQFNIAKKCLFQNTLIALPTGLGKTFIAGVVMLNYYRWFPDSKIVFVAPTKPLVAQQITACHEVCGISGKDAALVTGEVNKAKRIGIWTHKRVIYATPQSLRNDLLSGVADPLDIILLVIDEAHKGTGDYAYCQVVRYMMAKNPHFRILALTATPGNNPEAVQRIVDSLHISHIEIRNEASFDLQRYIFKKEITVRVIKMEDPVLETQRLLCKVMDPLLRKARNAQLVYSQSPIMLHPYACLAATQSIVKRKDKARWMWSYMRVLGSLARAMGNLMESSLAACYRTLKDFKENLIHGEKNDDKEVHLLKNTDFIKLMEECERRQAPGTAPHPKMRALVEIIMEHFDRPPSNPETPTTGLDGGSTSSTDTKVMIFIGLREVIDEVIDVLNEHRPMIRAARFVGQGTDKKGKKGLAQAKQLETIKQFKEGVFNVLVSTSVGEEGLDIGEIDRIICYDSSKSSIQMLQRVGRTGRKRTGYVDVLLSEDREEKNWDRSKENYADVQDTIISGNQLELYTDAERLLPDNVQPQCIQLKMNIEKYSPETDLPIRKKGATTTKKRKRNDDINRNVPLGATLGFVSASKLRTKTKLKKGKKAKGLHESDLEDDTDDEEIANGLRALTCTPKKKAKKSREIQRSLKDMLKQPIPDKLEDDDDDLDIQKGLVVSEYRDEDESSDSSRESSLSPVHPRKRQRPSAKSVADRKSEKTSRAPSASRPRLARKTDRWLLVSSDAEPAVSSATRDNSKKPMANGSTPGFKSAKHLETIEVISSSDASGDEGSSPSHKEKASDDESSQGSPQATYAVRAPVKGRHSVPLVAPPSSPMDERRDAPRRLVRRQSPSLMPPPPDPLPQSRKPKEPKLKMNSNPMLFDVEAVHSGDEVSEGDGSEVDMVESDSDRRFLVDVPETQVSPSYNQTAAYRLGMMTQASDSADGPIFKGRPKRVGAFVGGRTQVRKPADWSSSPTRGSEPDEYQMGSFVVNDDTILYDQSSEP